MAKLKLKYSCALLLTMDLLGGKWKLRILWHIINGDNSFSKLQKAIPDITHKMLITQLRELQESKLLLKNIISKKPLRIEYMISEEYRDLEQILNELCDFTKSYAIKNSIDV